MGFSVPVLPQQLGYFEYSESHNRKSAYAYSVALLHNMQDMYEHSLKHVHTSQKIHNFQTFRQPLATFISDSSTKHSYSYISVGDR